MKILFISSGKTRNTISPITYNQGESLKKHGVDITYFRITGKGIFGYVRSIPQIWKHLNKNKYDIIHAHYSFSAFAASLAGAKPLIVSLMGSDVKSKYYFKFFIRLFNKFFWTKLIVKSEDMKVFLGINNVSVIPNGVNLNLFHPLNQKKCKQLLDWDPNKKQVLFPSNPRRYEKNYKLSQSAFSLMNNSDYELKVLDNIPNEEMPTYYNAADVILLTSLWEGSPNVIKEAMACNRPIIATNVGDISWLLGDIVGSFITGFSPEEVSGKLKLALTYSKKYKRTSGKKQLLELGLDSESVANKIVEIYKIILLT